MSLETEVNMVYRPLFEAAKTPDQIDKIGGAWYSMAMEYAVAQGWSDAAVEVLRNDMRTKIRRAKAGLARSPAPPSPTLTPTSRQKGSEGLGEGWGLILASLGITVSVLGLWWGIRRLSWGFSPRMGTLRYDIIPE